MAETSHATRWKRRKAARPQEILDAALGVFAEKGFAGARMEDIAQKAGVTKGTIYLYFESKEAVFKTLLRSTLGELFRDMGERIDKFEGTARDLLHTALTAAGEFMLGSDYVVLPKIVIAEAGNFPEMVRFYRTEVVDKGLGLLGRIIAHGCERGEFRAVSPEHVAQLCAAPLLFIAFWRTTFAQFDTEPYDYQGLIDTHIDILLRGLAAN